MSRVMLLYWRSALGRESHVTLTLSARSVPASRWERLNDSFPSIERPLGCTSTGRWVAGTACRYFRIQALPRWLRCH